MTLAVLIDSSVEKNLLILCGGKSAEHEISLQSAQFISSCVDLAKYCVWGVQICREGQLRLCPFVENKNSRREDQKVSLIQSLPFPLLIVGEDRIPIHVVFPVLHGPGGEDGTIQGWMECLNVPYVGSGVMASAICMDKEISKILLQAHGIATVPFFSIRALESTPSYTEAVARLESSELFIKPAALGSSVGVRLVSSAQEYQSAVVHAFLYGNKVLIEKAMKGAEVECAVLGDTLSPMASGTGEIVMRKKGFYSYEAKYLDPTLAEVLVQARLGEKVREEVRRLALQAFAVLECFGMARVDFFVTETSVLINEVNTIPGFTSISLYPQLWHQAGITPRSLVEQLIQQALERFHRQSQILHFPAHLLESDGEQYQGVA